MSLSNVRKTLFADFNSKLIQYGTSENQGTAKSCKAMIPWFSIQ